MVVKRQDNFSQKNTYPVLLALLVLFPLGVSLVKDFSFTDPYYVSKHFYFLFLSLPIVLFLLWQLLKQKHYLPFQFNVLDVLVSIFFLYSFTISFLTPSVISPHPDIIIHIFLISVYWLIRYNISVFSIYDKAAFLLYLSGGLIIILLINSLYGFLQQINWAMPSHRLFKLGGAFGNPGPYSNFLVVLLPFPLLCILNKQLFHKRLVSISFATILFTLIILPFTMARTAWITFVIISSVLIWIKIKKTPLIHKLTQKKLNLIIAIGSFFLILVLFAYSLFGLKKESASGRLFIWHRTIEMIHDNFLFGSGFDTFSTSLNNAQSAFFSISENQLIIGAQTADNATFAFNEFLQITLELGVIGLALIILIFISALSFKVNKSKEETKESLVLIGIKTGLLAIIICSLLSYPLRIIPILYVFVTFLSIISGSYKGNPLKTIKIPILHLKLLTFFLIMGFGSVYFISFKRYNAEKKWKSLQLINRNLPPKEMMQRYMELEPVLSYNKYFMFNYGAELIYSKQFDLGVKVLERTVSRINDSNIHIYLGHAYFALNDYEKAEIHFKMASLIVPTKIFPLYNLVKVYKKTGRDAEALALAKKIIMMGEKVTTDIGTGVLIEMNEFLITGKLKL